MGQEHGQYMMLQRWCRWVAPINGDGCSVWCCSPAKKWSTTGVELHTHASRAERWMLGVTLASVEGAAPHSRPYCCRLERLCHSNAWYQDVFLTC